MNNQEHHSDNSTFGFWIYLMTDLLMFAVLFASYAALKTNTFGGVGSQDIIDLPFVLVETLILLTSSFTSGLGLLAANAQNKKQTLLWFGLTFLLGAIFLGMELTEFSKLIAEGHGPQASAYLSSFFALIGTHGLHIASGLLWLMILLVQIIRRGLIPSNTRKLVYLSLFWHFLDLVWIFIFTVVYLLGAK